MSPGEVRALPHAEIVEAAAYYTWRAAQEQHARDVAEMRANNAR